jgi:hypothetical protein
VRSPLPSGSFYPVPARLCPTPWLRADLSPPHLPKLLPPYHTLSPALIPCSYGGRDLWCRASVPLAPSELAPALCSVPCPSPWHAHLLWSPADAPAPCSSTVWAATSSPMAFGLQLLCTRAPDPLHQRAPVPRPWRRRSSSSRPKSGCLARPIAALQLAMAIAPSSTGTPSPIFHGRLALWCFPARPSALRCRCSLVAGAQLASHIPCLADIVAPGAVTRRSSAVASTAHQSPLFFSCARQAASMAVKHTSCRGARPWHGAGRPDFLSVLSTSDCTPCRLRSDVARRHSARLNPGHGSRRALSYLPILAVAPSAASDSPSVMFTKCSTKSPNVSPHHYFRQ